MAHNDPSSQTSLKGLFQGLIPEAGGVLQGTVLSASPLKIQAVNDDKLVIPSSLLILPKHLTDYTVKAIITANGEADGGEEKTLTVQNALKAGEKVHLLSLNNGKKYYILDRVV